MLREIDKEDVWRSKQYKRHNLAVLIMKTTQQKRCQVLNSEAEQHHQKVYLHWIAQSKPTRRKKLQWVSNAVFRF